MGLYNLVISGISMVSLLILDCIITKSNETEGKLKAFFRLAIGATLIVIVAEVCTSFLEDSSPIYRVPHIIANVIGFSVAPLIPLFIGYAINSGKNGKSVLYCIPSAINCVLSALSSVFPLIFWVDHENAYLRGELFWVYMLAYGASLLYLLFQTLEVAKQYQNNNRFVLYVLVLFIVCGTSVQVFAPELHASWFCVSCAMCLYYTYCSELYNQIDPLTALLNRRSYKMYLSSIEGRENASIFVFDIDDFKNINDDYGHPFGDFCLMAISACIKNVFFKHGLCYRIGGDEFCVICKEMEEREILELNKSFLIEIEQMRKTESRLPMVSIGYTQYNRKNGRVENAIFEADQKMYRFKQGRKDAAVTQIDK